MNDSKCMYCKSKAHGVGCPYSPHGKHVHPNTAGKCIYCGSQASGIGCPYNPFGKTHVHGIDYNSMISETIENSIIAGYVMSKLAQPIRETKAFELGLVNDYGKQIKKPQTIEEHTAYTPTDEYIFNLKQLLGSKINMANDALCMKSVINVPIDNYGKLCEDQLHLKDELQSIINSLRNVISIAYEKGMSTPMIEKLIIETITTKP